MKVIILCGGKGIRAFPFTEYLPKPMLPVWGSPILVHVIKNFINQGFTEFILAAGFRKLVLDDYFFRKDLGAEITILDTGDSANTGERVFACREYVGEEFMVTYGDGLCNVPLDQLLAFHHSHNGMATMTAVPLYSPYGVVNCSDEFKVQSMVEKPILDGQWINAGFFVFKKQVFDHWAGTDLERHVLPRLTDEGELFAYQHRGFFKSMDSYKEQLEFEEMYSKDSPPWVVRKGIAE